MIIRRILKNSLFFFVPLLGLGSPSCAEEACALPSTQSAPVVQTSPSTSSHSSDLFGIFSFSSSHQSFGLSLSLLSADPWVPLVGQGRGGAVGFEVSSYRGDGTFELMGRTRFLFGAGKASFKNDSTVNEHLFRLLSGEVLLGLRANLITSSSSSLHPYFGVAGKLGLNCLSLPDAVADSTVLTPTMVGRTLGVEWFAGIEFHKSTFIEFQIKNGSGAVGGLSTFQLGGASLVGGVAW